MDATPVPWPGENGDSAAERAAISACRLKVDIDGQTILDDVNFIAPEGKITYIVGPSGIGKSTLINVAVGTLPPADGSMTVLGTPIESCAPDELRRLRSRMGVLYQSGALFQDLTLLENVMFPLLERDGCPAGVAEEKARKALHRVGLRNRADHLPADVSGGQRKRAGLARALVTDSRLLLCDEPTSGLDPRTSAEIDNLLRSLHAEDPDRTIVVVSHDLDSIKDVAHYIVFLLEQTVRMHASKDEVINAEDPDIRDFFDRKPTENH